MNFGFFSACVGAKRTPFAAFTWAWVIGLSCIILLIYQLTLSSRPTATYRTSLYQLSAAVTNHLCHSGHRMDPGFVQFVRSGKLKPSTFLYDFPAFNPHFSLESYCNHTVTDTAQTIQRVKNYEVGEGMTLYFIDRGIISLFGNITFGELVTLYRLLHMILISIFTFYLLIVGFRLLTVWVMTFIGFAIVASPLLITLNASAMVLPCLLSLLGLYGLSMYFGWYHRFITHLPFLCVVGVLEFFLYYTRSSELPQLLLLMTGYGYYVWRYGSKRYLHLTFLVLITLLISIVGYLGLVAEVGGDSNLLRGHPIIHPIVLGLGSPENTLSKQEKIQFNDKYGLLLVQRFDPKVTTYYTPEYNKILRDYYIRLWKTRPNDMLNIYIYKWNYVFSNTDKFLKMQIKKYYGLNFDWVFWPFKVLYGLHFFLLFALLSICLGYSYYKKPDHFKYLWFILSIFTTLNYMESSLIASAFYLGYEAVLVFVYLTGVFLFWQQLLWSLGFWLPYQWKKQQRVHK